MTAWTVAGPALSASATDADSFLRFPSIHSLNGRSASIVWTSHSLSSGTVVVTAPNGDTSTFLAGVEVFPSSLTALPRTYYQYRADLNGLEPGMQYAYQIRANGTPVVCTLRRPLRFRTPSAEPAFQFLHFADSGDGGESQLQLFQEMAKEDPALVLANGDLAYDLATQASIEDNYFGVYRELMAGIPFFATLGNHEYYTESGKPSLQARVSPFDPEIPASDRGRYYSFDWGNVHFVALDSNAPLEEAAAGRGAMLRWLDEDLRRTRKFWRIAFFHHPAYAVGKHQDEPEAIRVREHVLPILERWGVQLVFNGHEHTYQRTHEIRGIVHVTSGGGGATTYYIEPAPWVAKSVGAQHYVRADVQGATIRVCARGIQQEEDLDAFTLAPAPIFTGEVVSGGSLTPVLASGGIAMVRGRNLCLSELPAPVEGEKPFTGCLVTVDSKPVRVLSADANHVSFVLPMIFSGSAPLTVTTENGSVSAEITVQPVAPALYPMPGDPGHAWAQHLDGTWVDLDHPALPGETITLFLTGLGPASERFVNTAVQIRFGSRVYDADRAVLSSASPGMYEVQFTLGSNVTSRSIQVIAGGTSSNRLLLH